MWRAGFCAPSMLLLDGFDIGSQIVNFQLYHDWVAIRGTEGISPHWHFPSAMISNEVIPLNDAGYNFRRKLATILSAQLREVSRMFFETRCGGPVSLGIRAMTNGAKAEKHLLPCLLLSHPLGRVRVLLFLRECGQAASQNKYQYRLDLILTSQEKLPLLLKLSQPQPSVAYGFRSLRRL